jgi:hypothetical protein
MATNLKLVKEVERMNSKNYQVWEKQYMVFGSIMRGFSGQLEQENWEEISQKAWDWAKTRTKELIEELYRNNEEEIEEEIPL